MVNEPSSADLAPALLYHGQRVAMEREWKVMLESGPRAAAIWWIVSLSRYQKAGT
jgi:hypothetical protein